MIQNKHLRKLIRKGPNYREPKTINWRRCRSLIEEGLNVCSSEFRTVDSMVTEDDLVPWKSEILSRVDRKITSLKRSVKYHKIPSTGATSDGMVTSDDCKKLNFNRI